MATQLDQATRDAVIAEANARARRFSISPEQALYNYAQENKIGNADVDALMGFGAGATDNWLKQRDAAITAWQQPAPQGNSYTPAAPYRGGAALTPDEVSQAKQWSQGRNGSEVMARAKELGLTPDQLGSAFGVSGDSVRKDFGYGTPAGYNGAGANAVYNNGQWSAPAAGGASGGATGGAGGGSLATQPPRLDQGMVNGQAPQQPSTSLGFSNPYMTAQADAITNQYTKALNQVMPGIGHGATMAGGYGGSRQGIAQGMAIDSMGQNLSNALANMYGQNYQQDQNTATTRGGQLFNFGLGLGGLQNQRYGQDIQLGLGLGQLDNQRYGMDQGFYTQNRQLDQSGAALGANLYNQGTQGNLVQGQGTYNIGTQQQNAPWAVTNNATNNTSPYTGTGVSNIQTQQGSTAGNTLGGALAGAQLWNLGFGSGPK